MHGWTTALLKDGKVCNNVWDYTFREKLQIDTTGRKILLTEPPMNPLSNREKMCEVMFERYQFGGVYVAIQAVLALYSQGKGVLGFRCGMETSKLTSKPKFGCCCGFRGWRYAHCPHIRERGAQPLDPSSQRCGERHYPSAHQPTLFSPWVRIQPDCRFRDSSVRSKRSFATSVTAWSWTKPFSSKAILSPTVA